MFKASLLIASSLSIMNHNSFITKDRLDSPTLTQPLQTNNTLIKEQHEEIIRSILVDSIKNEPENHHD
jgi:hypothetical protein